MRGNSTRTDSRIATMISKPFDMGPKLTSAQRAVSPIQAGSRIYIGTGCAAPRSLLAALETMQPRPADLEFVSFLTSGALPIDVALLQVSSPDARGFVSLGVSVDLAPAILSVARTAIAEVNPAMPRTHGESMVHL